MAKPIAAVVKLQVPAGQATPAPPVGTALGPHGVNIMEFVKQFNAKTAHAQGMITPIAMEEQLRFAIREGGRTVGAGVATKILM